MAVVVHLLGQSSYETVHALQTQLLEARIADRIPDVVLLLEHQSVITVGRSKGAMANVLTAGDVPVVAVERGGDVEQIRSHLEDLTSGARQRWIGRI